MKRIAVLLLAGSLGLNAALVLAIALGWREPAPAAKPVAIRPAAPRAPALPAIDASVWPSLQSEDLSVLTARLRAAGFPPAMLRAILQAQLGEIYTARRKALDPGAEERPFWKRVAPNPAVEAALRQLSREQQKQLREVLGPDADSDDPMTRYYEGRRTAGVPPAKLEDVRAILRDFDDRRSQVYTGGMLLPTDREKIQALERQQREAIARVLTPAEMLEYDLRSSNTAQNLRGQFGAFEPTEYEFRAIFALQREFDERFAPSFGQVSPAESQQRFQAQQQLTEQIKAALGPARAADYERMTNWEYRQASQLVARLQLPPETTGQLWTVQRELQEKLQTIQAARDLTPAARDEQRAQLATEATARLAPLLGGARGIDAYRTNGGYWLDQLRQPPPAPKQ